ncbi:hypothetical protein [Micromonospora sp. CV4]|uniref:hypothetical protein n=1 Tax=Micromonospora sp. CV4 TaxID=2478711 RepID=UPI000EF46AD1|nr:hypothetical protein [Micromonospora sp. CV4]RLP94454.1 hypothetical protein EAD98_16120 [Micromonospora sp. CV4]
MIWILRRYPITILVLAPYALLFVPMAVVYANPKSTFILQLLGAALVGTLLVETAALAARPQRRWRPGITAVNASHRHLYVVARLVAVISVAASITAAQAGQGTIFTQLGDEVAASPVARVAALSAGWSYLAFALLLASFLGGRANRVRVLCWIGLLVAGQVATAALTGITSPLFGYLSFIAGAGAICGLFRVREVVLLGAVILLAWPTLFALRNDIRADGGVSVAYDVTAGDRLRLDLQLTHAAEYDAPVDVGQPGPTEFVRYGLVPRILDPDRPAISTGALINQYLGGTATSSYSFLALGNVYFLVGWLGVPLYYAGWTALAVLLLRARAAPGPIRLSLFCFVLAGPLLWSSGYPDAMIAFLQHLVAALPVFAVLLLLKGRVRGRHSAARKPGVPSSLAADLRTTRWA